MSSIAKDSKRDLYFELGEGDWMSGLVDEPEGLSRESQERYVSTSNRDAWHFENADEINVITNKKHGFDKDDIEHLKFERDTAELKNNKIKQKEIEKDIKKKTKLWNDEMEKLVLEKKTFYGTLRKKKAYSGQKIICSV